MFTVTDNSYGRNATTINSTATLTIGTIKDGNWYDFTISSNCYSFMRRFMGRMETGKATITDPAMAKSNPDAFLGKHHHTPERLRN